MPFQVHTITPSEGLASGRSRVTIYGIDFRLPAEPEPGYTGGGSWAPTVLVTFDGVAADEVVPVARHRVEVVVPQFVGHPSELPKSVEVRVANLDDNGDPIVGEDLTIADAFTYRRPDLTSESDLVAITREFLRVLRRNLIDNVALTTDPDFSDDPATGLTAIGELPAVLVTGPMIGRPRSYPYRENAPRLVETSAGESATVAPSFTCAISWDIMLIADRKIESVNLLNHAIRYFERRPFLRIPESAALANYVEVDLYVEDWRSSDRWADRLHVHESRIRIEPVYLDDSFGLADSGAPVDEVVTAETSDAASALTLEVGSHE